MRRRPITLLVVACAAAAPLTGCGGPITPGELSRSIQTLESTAAEGSLLAKDVGRDRTKATFARVHSRDLHDMVDVLHHVCQRCALGRAVGGAAGFCHRLLKSRCHRGALSQRRTAQR